MDATNAHGAVTRALRSLVIMLPLLLLPGIALAQPAPPGTGTPTSPPPATATPTTPPPAPAGPDTVILKDHTQIRGTLREVRPDQHVVLAIANGQQALVRWQDIAWIEHDEKPITTNATGQPRGPAMLVQPVVPRGDSESDEERPKTLPYDPDKPVPPGYHLAERTRTGKIVWGSIMLAAGALWLGATLDSKEDKQEVAIVLSSGLALGGAVMLVLGIVWPKQVLERNDVAKRLPIDIAVRGTTHGGTSFVLGTSF